MTIQKQVSFSLNGREVAAEPQGNTRLAGFLRQVADLKGTKVACGRGECGACTVLVEGSPVLACLTLVARLENRKVETVEGLEAESLPLRQAFADCGAFQCGFCTAGQIVSAVALLRRGLPASDDELRHALSGNICRCTGYQSIIAAVRQAAPHWDSQTRKGVPQ